MNSPLLDKSLDFATQIVLFYEEFSKFKKDTTIAKQLLRSATSIGANINEAVYGNSKADFISKLQLLAKRNDNFRQKIVVSFCSLHFSLFVLLSSLKLSFPEKR